ncbi:MAG: DUF3899 domain-containing protein [Acholeplasmatales bacterium]|nr:DUF3899 domain-containing protein [Acholeplasmatales bacterium]
MLDDENKLIDEESNENKNKDPHLGMPNYVKAPQKEESKFHKMFLRNKKRYLIAFGVALVLWLIILALHKFDGLYNFEEATFSVGAIFLCIGGLSFTNNQGVFDSLSYGFNKIFYSFKGKQKYSHYYDYLTAKEPAREKGKYGWTTYVVVGFTFLLAALILYIIYVNTLNIELNSEIEEEIVSFIAA